MNKYLFFISMLACVACNNITVPQTTSLPCAGFSGTFDSGTIPDDPETATGIQFTEVGTSFTSANLIDLEFLPGTDGDMMLAQKDGTLTYVKKDFTQLTSTANITVEDSGEQGLLNIAAHPDFARNCLLFVFYTPSGGGTNQVDRVTVSLDTDTESFSISDQQTIIEFSKDESDSPGTNHNGGGMLFDADENLLIGVGDGGGSSSSDTDEAIATNTEVGLGKIHRIAPSQAPGLGGYELPSDGENLDSNLWPSIYLYGLRNPFTLALHSDGLLIGDVGQDSFEELNFSGSAALNFGWPASEGSSSDENDTDPILEYSHVSTTFQDEDDEDTGSSARSIIVATFYRQNKYQNLLKDRVIYSDFYSGFVRAALLDENNTISDDDHMGHLSGLITMQTGPDGYLYAISLGSSDKILRVDLE